MTNISKNRAFKFLNCKSFFIISLLLSLISSNIFAQENDRKEGKTYGENDFYIDPAISIEYNAPRISGGGENKRFSTTDNLLKQVYNLENIAIGAHIRFHDSFGFNANWVQTNLDSPALQHVQITDKKALYKIDHYNFSLLTYLPIVKNFFELFAETGVSDMRSDLSYINSRGENIKRNIHETRFFYGAGMQITFNSITSIRFSAQRYAGNVGLIKSDYTTVRIGFLRFF
jgi:hypothetical protein